MLKVEFGLESRAEKASALIVGVKDGDSNPVDPRDRIEPARSGQPRSLGASARLASFADPWEWNEGLLCWQRFVVETNGGVYLEFLQDERPFIEEAAAVEREHGGEMRAEEIMIVPTTVMDELHHAGVPVFDPEEGDEALKWAIRRDYPKLRTVADKGAKSGPVLHL